MKSVTLITGGARSGKSAHALAIAANTNGARRFFIATAEALDAEMTARIARHRADRAPDFATVEEPCELARALGALAGRADVVVVDCLTLWVSNLMMAAHTDEEILAAADMLARALENAPFDCVVVTDEVGWGLVPDNPMGRRFRDLLGWTNQRIADVASEVLLMVAGAVLKIK
ncbi:MAG TPA: bifunctional adenosylcobinamide kinase/adenosylcobinamide-phosphate guanylyltransferase [Candidatus Binataceae bacterium]|nr:bifunctional adenosylcobinamide kinase/adenosylcobinamide-phosphate guanylyltransferase [Candidatus Binataceae bacterium]